MPTGSLFSNGVKAYNNLPQGVQAAISTAPDAISATQALNAHLNNNPDAGRLAAEQIGGVSFGALGGWNAAGLAAATGLSGGWIVAAGIVAGYLWGKLGEEAGEKAWDQLTSPEFINAPRSYDEIMDRGKELNDAWRNARNWQPPRDPLALDLDGDGIEVRGVDGTVLFDHDGDGIRTGTGWVKSDDALLVLDRNGNGTIDNGSELFGVDTVLANGQKAQDGFAALRDLDSNGDGIFDAADAQFANVRLWRDLNQNGISDAGELMSLSDAGILNISLSASAARKTLAGGNVQTATATFTRTDGSTGEAGDVELGGTAANLDLASNPFYRAFTDAIPLSERAAALPDMGGSGRVRDLREAASQSDRLAGLLEQFGQTTTRSERMALLDTLLDAWADTSGMAEDLDSRHPGQFAFLYGALGDIKRSQLPAPDWYDTTELGYVPDVHNEFLTPEFRQAVAAWSNKIHILEAFNGQYFFNLPETASGTLNPSHSTQLHRH